MGGIDATSYIDDDSSEAISDHHSAAGLGRKSNKERNTSAFTRGGIGWAKALVIVIFLFTMLALSLASFFFTKGEERSDFQNAFKVFARNVIETVDLNAGHVGGVFGAFVLGVTSAASLWPTVTIPNWASQSAHLASQTGSHQVGFFPLVEENDRSEWEMYSATTFSAEAWPGTTSMPHFIWRNTSASDATPAAEDRSSVPYYAPLWQAHALEINEDFNVAEMINRNGFDFDSLRRGFDEVLQERVPVQTEVLYVLEKQSEDGMVVRSPVSALVVPIFDSSVGSEQTVVALTVGWLEWSSVFSKLLPEGVNGIVIVVSSSGGCQRPFTYQVNGQKGTFLGFGDRHDEKYGGLYETKVFDIWQAVDHCGQYTFNVYPSNEFEGAYDTYRPLIYTAAIIMVFFIAFVMFLVYDWTVERETEKIENKNERTNALVDSLFPANVRDRLIHGECTAGAKKKTSGGFDQLSDSAKSLNFGSLCEDNNGVFISRPIADLFPDATVMFADISGFTAWSSTREPTQVFTLLETMYNAFDKIAKKRKVFKVETVGDCYVAAAGLPDFRKDHAIAMARFANDCLLKMKGVVQSLELTLGPDTADLGMRIGLHSGPVTAGVLRGEKSRFQLFGDTVNTASRIESTGFRDRIHISAETAQQLRNFGKEHWLEKRETMVQAKGKGEIQTYWLTIGAKRNMADNMKHSDSTHETADNSSNGEDDSGSVSYKPLELISRDIKDNRVKRLIGWNVDVLKRQLRQVLAMRDPSSIPSSLATVIDGGDGGRRQSAMRKSRSTPSKLDLLADDCDRSNVLPLDEVEEVIELPSEPMAKLVDPNQIELSDEVTNQLTDFVTAIAKMYHNNPFHCFEHASHVTMSVCKLLSRVVTAESIDYANLEVQQFTDGEELHKYTYGITSDPICQFACALSALIHDVDHSGVPNATLVEEGAAVAQLYNNKSCAEQNSFDLAWHLLMEPKYVELRDCIYANSAECNRFRQVLVNSVMATDIVDRELGAARKARWVKAFANETKPWEMTKAQMQEDSNRKATIVLEHLIQASDVSHTMQHWHVYIQWNERLFQEMYRAWKNGRAKADPSINWYKNEIGFFDFYLIPLAKKLKECGVFGVASDEYLSYVQANRNEWEAKGEQLVVVYLENYRLKFGNE